MTSVQGALDSDDVVQEAPHSDLRRDSKVLEEISNPSDPEGLRRDPKVLEEIEILCSLEYYKSRLITMAVTSGWS